MQRISSNLPPQALRLNLTELSRMFNSPELERIIEQRFLTPTQYNRIMQEEQEQIERIILNDINEINEITQQEIKYKKILDPEEISNIKKVTYNEYSRNKESINECCYIELEDFNDNETILRLPCKHYFKKDAIMQWFQKESHRCPLCRYELNFREVEKNQIEEINDLDSEKISWLYDIQKPSAIEPSAIKPNAIKPNAIKPNAIKPNLRIDTNIEPAQAQAPTQLPVPIPTPRRIRPSIASINQGIIENRIEQARLQEIRLRQTANRSRTTNHLMRTTTPQMSPRPQRPQMSPRPQMPIRTQMSIRRQMPIRTQMPNRISMTSLLRR